MARWRLFTGPAVDQYSESIVYAKIFIITGSLQRGKQMEEIKDFECAYDNSAAVIEEAAARLKLKFPEAYKNQADMVRLSRAVKEKEGADFCILPFCHTLEAEALGAVINYGDARTGPRAKEYICTSLEEILKLPQIDYTKGRIHEVLSACKNLSGQNEKVVLKVSGPFTILDALIDAGYVYRGMKKEPQLMKEIFWKLGEEILRFVEEAKENGVGMISYADSSGGVNILGPKRAEQVVEDFTYEFMKRMESLADGRMLILLCPKVAFSLIGAKKAEFRTVKLLRPMRYGEACVELIGSIRFAGQMCMKNSQYLLKDGNFKELILK